MAGLETATSASERLQTHALDRQTLQIVQRNCNEEAAFRVISLSFVCFSDDLPVDNRTAETCSMIE
jgi:type II secretory pathway component GspD/PulD (secretin)